TRLLPSVPTRRSSDLSLPSSSFVFASADAWPPLGGSLRTDVTGTARRPAAPAPGLGSATVFAATAGCAGGRTTVTSGSVSVFRRSEEHTSELQSRENI